MNLTLKTAVIAALALATAAGMLPDRASATTPDNRQKLEEHFAGMGQVVFDLYAPLGTDEMGGAVIDQGLNAHTLVLKRIDDKGRVVEVLTEGIQLAPGAQPFTFLYHAKHLMTYSCTEWIDPQGVAHRRGDLVVRDLQPEAKLAVVFEIKDVIDLNYISDGARSVNNLLWQPARHFLNASHKQPTKHNYFRLAFDEAKNEYQLLHYLRPMPDAGEVDAANLNNRAIYYYDRGQLLKASRLLEQSWTVAGYDQSIIQNNQNMVKGEIENLAGQGGANGNAMFDDGLLYFFQGNYPACMHTMEGKRSIGFSDEDLAMIGISLATEIRWPEADSTTIELDRRCSPLLADYLYEMVQIAWLQGYDEIAGRYIEALKTADADHPGYYTAWARLLSRSANDADAIRILEEYLRRPHGQLADLHDPMLELYRIYLRQGRMDGLDRLTRESLKGPIIDLLTYIDMIDYYDLSSSLIDVVPEERDRLESPEGILEGISIQELVK